MHVPLLLPLHGIPYSVGSSPGPRRSTAPGGGFTLGIQPEGKISSVILEGQVCRHRLDADAIGTRDSDTSDGGQQSAERGGRDQPFGSPSELHCLHLLSVAVMRVTLAQFSTADARETAPQLLQS